MVIGLYDSCFAYQHGDPSKPSFSAAPCMHGNLRSMFTYQKACMFRMKAGMGDTVFGALYLVLRARRWPESPRITPIRRSVRTPRRQSNH